jgi:hypothetical protein
MIIQYIGNSLCMERWRTPKVSCNFIQSLQATGGVILLISTQKPPSTVFPIHYSLIILAFGTVEPEVQLPSLNKHQYHTNKAGPT